MRKVVCLLSALILTTSNLAFAADNRPPLATEPNRILFLTQSGHAETALNLYRDYATRLGHHDFDLLQNMSLILLEQGYKSNDIEKQIMTLFGAGISLNEKALYLLEEGMKSSQPELQLVSMSCLARFQCDQANTAINKALGSNFLLIRLEGVCNLAKRHAPTATAQAEALMSKVPDALYPLFPQIFAMIGTPQSIRILHRLMANPNESVRVEAIYSAAKFKRDDMLPTIRMLATHHSIPQQEACAYAFGVLGDETAVPRLEILVKNGAPNVRLTALLALNKLGRHEVSAEIVKAAEMENLFAIHALGDLEGSEDILYRLLERSQNPQVRVNAIMALLKLQDTRISSLLPDYLIKDMRDIAFGKTVSPGKTLVAYKVVPSAQQNLDDEGVGQELSLCIREEMLEQAARLPEQQFLKLVHQIFNAQQNDLVPVAVEALEELRTPTAIALLKKHQQQPGAPLIRNYCNLALYRLKEEGPYAENLRNWVAKQWQEELISFRPFVPWNERDQLSPYQLTPRETSRLLVESVEAFVQRQDDEGISVFLDAVQHGNDKNRYALLGLLIRLSN